MASNGERVASIRAALVAADPELDLRVATSVSELEALRRDIDRVYVVFVDDTIAWNHEGSSPIAMVRESCPHVALVGMMESASTVDIVQAIRSGADDFVDPTDARAIQGTMERTRVLTRTRRSHRQLRTRLDGLLNTLAVGVFRSSVSSEELLECNAAFLRLLGFDSEADVLGVPLRSLYKRPNDRDRLLSEIQSRGGIRDFEVELERRDGSSVWVSLTETATTLLDGTMVMDGIAEDVSHRRIAAEQVETSRKWLQSVLDGAPVTLFAVDDGGIVTLWRGAQGAVLSSQPEPVGHHYRDVFGSQSMLESIQLALSGRGSDALVEAGDRFFQAWCTPSTSDSDVPQGMTCVCTDTTPRVLAQRSLKQREDLLQAVIDAEPALVALLNRDGSLVELNPAGRYLLGVGDPAGFRMQDLLLADDSEAFVSCLADVATGSTARLEVRTQSVRGEVQWLDLHAVPLRGAEVAVQQIVCVAQNVTEQKRAEEQLVHDALHDALTGLPNRNLFRERLNRALQMNRRKAASEFAVLFMDMDRFKIVVDSLGHTVSDSLLVSIARRLEACVRPGDTVSRHGGDEYILLLEDIGGVSDATAVAENINKALTVPFRVGGHEVFTTASIGIALGNSSYGSPEDVLRDADTAMFRAKAAGRSRYQLFDTDMHVQAVSRLRMETELRHALERSEFRLHYQPVVDTHDGSVSSFEALLRWQHPERGMVYPNDFIPVVEETGLVVPIGEWVLETGMRQARLWSDANSGGKLSVAINLSAHQIESPGFLNRLERITDRVQVSPRLVRLEITEGALLKNTDLTSRVLRELRSRGFEVHIDDFGTGYSSLSYLHRFSVDGLKIDKAFVQGIDIPENRAIIRSIVTLAEGLGVRVIAEGVETAHQLAQVRDLGCQLAQGYFFSRPVQTAVASALIKSAPFKILHP